MFYATDMFPSRQKVYEDYKMYKPKMHKHDALYRQKKRDRKKKTHTDEKTTRSEKYTVPVECLRSRYFPFNFVK